MGLNHNIMYNRVIIADYDPEADREFKRRRNQKSGWMIHPTDTHGLRYKGHPTPQEGHDPKDQLGELVGNPHGLASGMKIEDIAAKHGATVEHIVHQLDIGIDVELEHTSSEREAAMIAMDHLVEDPDYYSKIHEMESLSASAKRRKRKKRGIGRMLYSPLMMGHHHDHTSSSPSDSCDSGSSGDSGGGGDGGGGASACDNVAVVIAAVEHPLGDNKSLITNDDNVTIGPKGRCMKCGSEDMERDVAKDAVGALCIKCRQSKSAAAVDYFSIVSKATGHMPISAAAAGMHCCVCGGGHHEGVLWTEAGIGAYAMMLNAEHALTPASGFAIPNKREYCIIDRAHAADSIKRARLAGGDDMYIVEAACESRYPGVISDAKL